MTRGILFSTVVLVACAQPAPNGDTPAPPASTVPGAPTPPASPAGNQASDWAAIEALERQARALTRTTGCTSTSGCRTAPVGNRACGGPRYYLVYCAASTDSVALYRKLSEIVAAENAYNRKYEIMSTCEFRMPPDVTLSGGECRGAP